MEEVLIKINSLKDYDYWFIADYFNKKDIVSLKDILDALDYELERQELAEKIKNGDEPSEQKLEHFRRNYDNA